MKKLAVTLLLTGGLAIGQIQVIPSGVSGTGMRTMSNSNFAYLDANKAPGVYAAAKCDGATNDTAVIQAAINSTYGPVYLPAGVCIITPPLIITHNGESLVGQGMAQTPSFFGTVLQTATTTGDMIQITGGGSGNCSSGGVNFVTVSNLSLRRSVVGTAGTGINITKGCGVNIGNVYSYDNFKDVYVTSTANSRFHDIFIYKSTSVGSVRYGVQLDGSVGSAANNSNYIDRLTVTGTGSNITGLYLGPGNVGDVFVDRIETAVVDYGVQVVPTTCTNFACNEDIRFNSLILDQCLVTCFYVNNLSAGSGGSPPPTLIINDIYAQGQIATSNVIGIDLEGTTSGVVMSAGTIRTVGTDGIGIKLGASAARNIFHGFRVDDTSIGMDISGSENIVTSPSFYSAVGTPSTTFMRLNAGANLNVITSYVCTGYATNCATLTSSSLNNTIWPGIIDPTHITNSLVSADGAYGNVLNGSGGSIAPVLSVCGTIVAHSTNEAGSFTSGTSGTCGAVITFDKALMGSPDIGWSCSVDNATTPANKMTQVGSSRTTATFTGTTVSGDTLYYRCKGF